MQHSSRNYASAAAINAGYHTVVTSGSARGLVALSFKDAGRHVTLFHREHRLEQPTRHIAVTIALTGLPSEGPRG